MRSLVGSLAGSLVKNETVVPYVARSQGVFGHLLDRTNKKAQLQAMGSVGTLFGIVSRTSNSTSRVDWKLYRKQVDNRRRFGPSEAFEDRQEVTKHPALAIWNAPNEFFTQQEFIETFQQHMDLTGEGWWVVQKMPGMSIPQSMWPVRPDRIEPVPHPTDFISGYVYHGPDGEKIPLETDEVIQLKMPNPLDLYRGMGPVQAIMADLDSVRYSAEWNRNFFLNSAEPGGIIEVPEGLSDPEFRKLRARWNEQHRGVAAAHRVAILEHGIWKDRKYTNRDMQFVELRNVSREVIREAFSIPKFALGDVTDVNRANAEASRVWFAQELVIPRLERIKQALNSDFLPMFGSMGQNLEFDYCDPIPPDKDAENKERESRARTFAILVREGVDPVDAAMIAGLPEVSMVERPRTIAEQPALEEA